MDSPNSWRDEAQAVIKDVEAHVKSISVSDELESNERRIYLNIVTKEDKSFCVELSARGFRVVGREHDSIKDPSEQYFDTPYSLLSQISDTYTNCFANELINKLNAIKDD